jgi:hypothetical protein
MPVDREGADCSWGASGSMLMVIKHGKIWSIGPQSAFYDLTDSVPDDDPPLPPADPNMKTLPVSKNIVADCAFSYEISPLGQGSVLARVVSSNTEIPGYTTPDQAIAEAQAEFEDPNYTKTILNGMIYVPTSTNDNNYEWVKDPLLFRFDVAGGNVIGVADPNSPDNVTFTYLPDTKDGVIAYGYPNPGLLTVDLFSSNGPEQYQPDPTGMTSGDFIDDQQQTFGTVLNNFPGESGNPTFVLVYANGQYEVEPYSEQ